MTRHVTTIIVAVCLLQTGLAAAVCLDVRDDLNVCRYTAGDAWCVENHRGPYAYADACMKRHWAGTSAVGVGATVSSLLNRQAPQAQDTLEGLEMAPTKPSTQPGLSSTDQPSTDQRFLQAVRDGDIEKIRLLLTAGANVNARDEKGRTAMILATGIGHPGTESPFNMVMLLLSAGADVNLKDNEGTTPLVCAVWLGHENVVKALLDAGADVHAKDVGGITALKVAYIVNDAKMVQLLKQASDSKETIKNRVPTEVPDVPNVGRCGECYDSDWYLLREDRKKCTRGLPENTMELMDALGATDIASQAGEDQRGHVVALSISGSLPSGKSFSLYFFKTKALCERALQTDQRTGAIKGDNTIVPPPPVGMERKPTEGKKIEAANTMVALTKNEEDAKRKETAMAGEPIEYGKFYAMTEIGMPVGKRYRFYACLGVYSSLSSADDSKSQSIDSLDMSAFDDVEEYRRWLEGGKKYCGWIVAAMTARGKIGIFRLH